MTRSSGFPEVCLMEDRGHMEHIMPTFQEAENMVPLWVDKGLRSSIGRILSFLHLLKLHFFFWGWGFTPRGT